MEENHEGFFYPNVGNLCIGCGLCVEKCQSLSPVRIPDSKTLAYAVYLKDDSKLLQSSSGGAFSGLAETILDFGGIVFGAAYSKDLEVEHIFAENAADLNKLKSSKYVESYIGDSYIKAEIFLKQGRKVLFAGTPCQIGGLKNYLGKDYDNLYTVDLICHGVPSRKLFRKYLEWLGTKMRDKIIYLGFRDKDVGGWTCGGKTKTKTKTKTKVIEGLSDPYYATFLRGETYRESCYSCQYANTKRIGDITLGDFWGVENFFPEIDRKRGVSCILVNTRKGEELFKEALPLFHVKETSVENICKENGNLNSPVVRPAVRSSIYGGIDSENVVSYFRQFKRHNPFLVKIWKTVSPLMSKNLKVTVKRILRASL